MMNGLSTAAQMGAVKVSTIASFSGSSMTATRSAAAPHTVSLRIALRRGLALQANACTAACDTAT